jgi:hypothetical protein
MGSWFLHNNKFFADFHKNTKEVPTKIRELREFSENDKKLYFYQKIKVKKKFKKIRKNK